MTTSAEGVADRLATGIHETARDGRQWGQAVALVGAAIAANASFRSQFEAADQGPLRAFIPHFRHTLRTQRRIGWFTHHHAQSGFTALGLAAIALDQEGRVVHRNAIAEELLQTLPAGCWRFGRLQALGKQCAPSLPESMAACGAGQPVGITALLPGPPPRVVQATLLSWPAEADGHLELPAPARYLLLVEVPRSESLQAARSVAPLFGLSPAEVRVLGGLLEGASPAGIAQASGTSLPTVRTQISQILAKTGTSGQTELLVLLQGLR
jgi:DNA-binding CsgD family transcriptional regulator